MASQYSLKRKAVVIDNGTETIKCGLSGKDRPHSAFPTLIGYPKKSSIMTNPDDMVGEYYIGKDALAMKGVLDLQYPIVHGIIKDWDAMEKIWSYIFNDVLSIDPSKYSVLLTEPALNPRPHKKKMLEIMFEKFRVPSLNLAQQAACSLYANGRITGCVVDIGEGITQIVPIFEGFTIDSATYRVELGGGDITTYLQRLLMKKGYSLSTSSEKEIVKNIKETLCYIALEVHKDLIFIGRNPDKERVYLLPDGTPLKIGAERFLAPDCLFTPSIIGKEMEPLDEMIVSTISNCDSDLQRDLYSNIILSGGSTLFPGFKERLEQEIKEHTPESMEVNIIAPSERKYSVWVGGSFVSSFYNLPQKFIDQGTYKDMGVEALLYMC